jgi:hypothetical protein
VSQTYTAVVKQAEDWWIGWVEETLRLTLEEALELSRREAREAAGDGFEEIPPYEARGASAASQKAWLCHITGRSQAHVVAQS